MIPNTKDREIESSEITESAIFGISRADEPFIMSILRDQLYSDKVLAVLREYGANAWDSHRESGKADVPIKVTLPTRQDSTLYIRDYGHGLSRQEVFEVYTQYGASTKRSSDIAVGMLGIGCKSGFCYSDSFTITSWHAGKKSMYVAVLDQSDKGVINLLDESDCGDETGIEIQIAVRPEDITEFTSKAEELYQHFKPQPEINITLQTIQPEDAKITHGIVYTHQSSWTAVMGCVPYKVDLQQLKKPDGKPMIVEAVFNLSGYLYFNIGEVQVNASREDLKYSTSTKDVLAKKFELLIDEYVEQSMKAIDGGDLTTWQKKIRAQVFREFGLPIPDQWKDLVEEYVTVKEAKTFSLIQNKSTISRISVHTRSRFIIHDTSKDLQGYHLGYGDYVVKPQLETTIEEVCKELQKVIADLNIVGIPVINISTLHWYEPFKPSRGKSLDSKKYQVTTFRYNHAGKRHPKSARWEIEKREPTPEDVFVILVDFKTKGHDIYAEYCEDDALAKNFSGTMPIIYGYKSTEKKPKAIRDCIGTHYPLWRPKFAMSLITPKIRRILSHWLWARAFSNRYSHRMKSSNIKPAYDFLIEHLGEYHPITELIDRHRKAAKVMDRIKDPIKRQIALLGERLEEEDEIKTESKLALENIYKIYPLLSLSEAHMHELWGDDGEKWIEYVKLVDRALAFDSEK